MKWEWTIRYANIVLKKADIPLSKRAGELTEEDTEKLITIMQVGTFWVLRGKIGYYLKIGCIINAISEPPPVQDSWLVP